MNVMLNSKKSMPNHIIVKLQITKDKEILKTAREEK